MRMRKQSLYLGAIGLLLGLFSGYFYADYYNRAGAPSRPPTSPSGELPPNHPPISSISPGEIAAATKAAESQPNDFQAQMMAARLLYQADRLDEAATFYERAHRLQPDDYEAIVQLGNVHFDIGLNEFQRQQFDHSTPHFLEAAKWYERALQKNPNDVNVRTDYGLTYYYRRPQDLDRAIVEYRRSLQIQPQHAPTLANLTIALLERGDLDEARRTMAKLEQAAPRSELLARATYSFALTLIEQKNWDEASLMVAKLEQLAPGAPVIADLRRQIEAGRGSKIQPH